MINRDDSAFIAQERRNLALGKTHAKPIGSASALAPQTASPAVAGATKTAARAAHPPLRADQIAEKR